MNALTTMTLLKYNYYELDQTKSTKYKFSLYI